MSAKRRSQTAQSTAERPVEKQPTRAPGRVIIENVQPEVDGGRFPIKRTLFEDVEVTADIFADGHDSPAAVLRYRRVNDEEWQETRMQPLVNDRWRARFRIEDLADYVYTVEGWVDRFLTWRHKLEKKYEAGQAQEADLMEGAELLEQAAQRASGADARRLEEFASAFRSATDVNRSEVVERALGEELRALAERDPDRSLAAVYEKELRVQVDDERARFSAWYEMFPRSAAAEPGKHGTFRDVIERLPYVASMGFDVLYLPSIHPIGRTFRKGKNNDPVGQPEDPGSPWAIGGPEGGHKSIHPQLGTLEDFRDLVAAAAGYGMEIALDIAFQATPDHPYVREHPEWFRWRPDGTVQYAENPPKKYQDIYPFEFENEHWRELWEELKSVFLYWAEQGVRIFRVDNPHTKPFAFWERCIAEVKREYPQAIFLSEAFTRPKVMYRLAKVGFTQSYTYFTWRNTKWELTEYFTELTQTGVREFFRPNLWPNTPDILPEYLQYGGRPAFVTRLVLAATLGASYGMYGPAFELQENRPVAPGKEEYLNSEKYEIRHWERERADSLREMITRVNRIRRGNAALHGNFSLRFHQVDNDQLIAYSKHTDDFSNIILVVVNLDPYHTQSGWLHLPLESLGMDPHQPFQVHDLLTEARYFWSGPTNFVELNPHVMPAHIFLLRRKVRTERDFDYFM